MFSYKVQKMKYKFYKFIWRKLARLEACFLHKLICSFDYDTEDFENDDAEMFRKLYHTTKKLRNYVGRLVIKAYKHEQ